MIRLSLVFVMLSSVVFGFFMPTFSFGGGGDSNNIDKNFERDDKTEIVLDKKEAKIYYDSTPSAQMTFDEAQAFCKNSNYLGYKEWKVPTKEESVSLLELSRTNITVKHAFKNVQKAIYWTATEEKFNEAWFTDFDLGRYSTSKRDNKYRTLCVLKL
ncbi:MAG: DUF1566 domain-containing protein [Sulfurimonas sp.]|jgi:hypothetical protein